MSESGEHDDDRTDPGWLAAYAVGLAYSDQTDAQCVQQLMDAADSGPLRVARSCLNQLACVAAHVHRRACHLLEQAAGRHEGLTSHPAGGDQTRPAAPDDHQFNALDP